MPSRTPALLLAVVCLFAAVGFFARTTSSELTSSPAVVGDRSLDAIEASVPGIERSAADEARAAIALEVADFDRALEAVEATWRVRVEVRASERTQPRGIAPLSQAPLAIWFTRGHAASLSADESVESTAEVQATADANGQVAIEMDLPDAWRVEHERARAEEQWDAFRDTQIHAHLRVLRPGYQRGTSYKKLKAPFSETGQTVVLNSAFRRGSTIPVVVRHGGAPVKASVRLLKQNARGEWRSVERGRPSGPAMSILQVEDEGRYAITARSPGLGTAWLPSIEVQHGSPAETVELDLEGSGTLSGRLIDPAGQPVLGHGVRAILARTGKTSGLSTNDEFDHERGTGCAQGASATDEEGRFAITGLQPGDYRLLASGPVSHGDAVLLMPQVASGTTGLELTVQRHALVVRAVDHGGEPVELFAQGRNDRLFRLDSVRAYCYPAQLTEGEWPRSPWSVKAGAHLIAQLEPERDYVLGVHSSRHALEEQRIRLSPGDYQREIVVTLPAPEPPAELYVLGVVPGDRRTERTLKMSLETLEGRELLEWESDYEEDQKTPLRLAAGRYRIRATEDRLRSIRYHVPTVQEIELRSGEVRRLTVELGAAGFLGVHPEVEPAPESKDPESSRGIQSTSVRVELVAAATGETRMLEFPHQGRFFMSHPPPDPWVPVGTKLKAVDPIAVGEYTVRLRLAGHVTYEQQVRIEPGQRTWVRATLVPTQSATPESRTRER